MAEESYKSTIRKPDPWDLYQMQNIMLHLKEKPEDYLLLAGLIKGIRYGGELNNVIYRHIIGSTEQCWNDRGTAMVFVNPGKPNGENDKLAIMLPLGAEGPVKVSSREGYWVGEKVTVEG